MTLVKIHTQGDWQEIARIKKQNQYIDISCDTTHIWLITPDHEVYRCNLYDLLLREYKPTKTNI